MTMNQIVLVWALMGAQGVRRLYESVAIFKPSASTMSIFHYIGGLGFYGLIGIAVWIEGACEYTASDKREYELIASQPR